MRRFGMLPLLALLGAVPLAAPPPAAAQSTAPHGWLFGAWIGGLFPPPTGSTASSCLAQPTVIFTRDVVLRATLTETTYTQRVIETARTGSGLTDFLFSPAVNQDAANSLGLLGLPAPKAAAGFGCEDDNTLHVARVNDNQISFPGCSAFPYPLVRCGTGR